MYDLFPEMLQKLATKFANNTTLHGAARIIRSRSRAKRVIWIIMFMAVSLMFSYQLLQLLRKYFAYEKQFNIDVRADDFIFPNVTVCNMRALDVMIIRQIYHLFSLHSMEERDIFLRHTADEYVAAFYFFYETFVKPSEQVRNQDDFEWSPRMLLNLNKSITEFALSRFEDLFVLLDNSVLLEQRLLFDGHFLSQCFTFSYKNDGYINSEIVFVTNRPTWAAMLWDGRNALPKEEMVQGMPHAVNKLFEPTLTRVNYLVYLHNTDDEPSVPFYDRYFMVPPGYLAMFSVNKRGTEKLAEPYGHCQIGYPFEEAPAGRYIQTMCQKICMHRKVMDNCGCRLEEFNAILSGGRRSNLPLCGDLAYNVGNIKNRQLNMKLLLDDVNKKVRCAVETFTNNSIRKSCNDFCPRACFEIHYDISMSLTKLPVKSKHVRNLSVIISKGLRKRNDTERLRLYPSYFPITDKGIFNQSAHFDRENFASELTMITVELLASDLSVTSEVPEYTVSQLLGDIGGQLGLWIGMSIMTIAEILEFIFYLVYRLLKKCAIGINKQKECESI